MIAVLGSINMDIVVRCKELPRIGETVKGLSAVEVCGGKGANQAVAAAKAGGGVRMIGRVGEDSFAERLQQNLIGHHVNCEGVRRSTSVASGLAIVAVEESGNNSILLVPGANGLVSEADVEKSRLAIESADVLLLQMEIPAASVLSAIQLAKAAGVRCILDPAPVPSEWTDELLAVDLVCPNETEAASITGLTVETVGHAQEAAKQLQRRGARHVVITLGERGAVLLTDGVLHHIDAMPIKAIDTTASGDAFAGALSVRWSETDDLLEAIRFASVAGAIAAERHGAQPSIATRHEIETRLPACPLPRFLG